MSTELQSAKETLTGTLIRVHRDGYGFIQVDNSHEEFFISVRDFPNRASWFTGQCVRFEPTAAAGPSKARRAVNVTLLPRRRKVVKG